MAEWSNAAVSKTVEAKPPGVRIPLSPLNLGARRSETARATSKINTWINEYWPSKHSYNRNV